MSQNICNICGANYEYRNSRWVCPGCGAYKEEELSNEEVTLLYNAAQKLRFADFDEAEKAYTDIIEKYPQNHNGYWGRLLSKYGIKYEEDFDGHKIPTCYATSIESVVSDKDYAKAISLADEDTKEYYQKQAEYIERVRKEWVEKARKEKPYDIFICYKDSDLANGIERTRDSVEALELYNHLQAQGYRVFFSRESLRNKVGEKYEPYIFNALSTAKVMLVYGTSSEYITSTWLKNEWTRYEKRMEAGEKLPGSLIVACDGFSPNELPKILSSKQCFDAKRKTFYIDLDKCIKRLIQESPTIEQFYAPKSKTVSSELHEHVYKTKIVKATCVAKGYTIHKCDCGYEYRDSYTPLVDHKFKIINEVSPTCTTSGHKEMACDVCGEKKKDALPALGHNYSKWVESKHPTCTENGEKQRKCTHCGEIEKQTIPASGHAFDGITLNGDGTQTSYCRKYGCSQTSKTINESERVKRSSNVLVIPFKEIILNIGRYWKPYFTNETTIMQKIKHWVGYCFTLVFLLMFSIPTISHYRNNPTSTEEITIPSYWVIILLINFALWVCALAGVEKEKKKYQQQEIPYPVPVNSRVGMRIASNFFVVMSAFFYAMVFSANPSDAYSGVMMGSVFILWSIILMLYSHCPKEYKKIRFTSTAPPVPKINLSIMGIVITFALLMAIGIVGGTTGALGEDSESVLKDAENLYLSGNAAEAAALLKEHGIEENQEAYSYVANGEYKKSKLENIVLPNGTLSIENDAFKFYHELKSVIIPDGVTSIGESAFDGCDNLTSVTIPDSVTSIGDSAFHNCDALENVIIGNGVTIIGYNSFNGCDKLKNIFIGDGVTTIGNFAFSGCKELTNLTIPASVTSIGMCAFTYCDNLTSIVIPKEVTNIGEKTFFDCKNLTRIYYCGTEQQWSEITKGFNWDQYSPGWLQDYEQIPYTIIFNYKDN